MSEIGWFKANSPADRSQDIVVSFSAKWLELLQKGEIELIFRRRYPKTFQAKRLFVYVGRPHLILIGYFEILRVSEVTFKNALTMKKMAHISSDDLNEYFDGYMEIGCFHLSPIRLFKQTVPLSTLKEYSGFHPPQSFVALSHRATEWLLSNEELK